MLGSDLLRFTDLLENRLERFIHRDLPWLVGLCLLQVNEPVSDLRPFQVEDLAAAHPGIQGANHDVSEMDGAGRQELRDFIFGEVAKP
ncbi:MAG: hypothetical protein GXY78_05910 [Deltaproteobacteria bacterium]|nr:hypothetical protein [Deltaproteobacteria bacterium]